MRFFWGVFFYLRYQVYWRLWGHRAGGMTPHALGKKGESLACVFLRAKGMAILASNFRAPHGGEVDIVASKEGMLLFVEVKTRRKDYGRPHEAVDRAKQSLIERGAYYWMSLLKQGSQAIPYRFDVIEVRLLGRHFLEVNHIKDIF